MCRCHRIVLKHHKWTTWLTDRRFSSWQFVKKSKTLRGRRGAVVPKRHMITPKQEQAKKNISWDTLFTKESEFRDPSSYNSDSFRSILSVIMLWCWSIHLFLYSSFFFQEKKMTLFLTSNLVHFIIIPIVVDILSIITVVITWAHYCYHYC